MGKNALFRAQKSPSRATDESQLRFASKVIYGAAVKIRPPLRRVTLVSLKALALCWSSYQNTIAIAKALPPLCPFLRWLPLVLP